MTNKFSIILITSIMLVACGGASESDDGATLKVGGKSDNYAEVTSKKEGLSLPDNMPADVPVYAGATVKMKSTAQNVNIITMESGDALDEVYSFYETKMTADNWEIVQQSKTAQGGSIAAKKDARNLTVTMAPDHTGKTQIILNFR